MPQDPWTWLLHFVRHQGNCMHIPVWELLPWRTLVIQPSPTDPPRPSVTITVLQTHFPFRARLRWNLPVLKAPEAVAWKQQGSESPGSQGTMQVSCPCPQHHMHDPGVTTRGQAHTTEDLGSIFVPLILALFSQHPSPPTPSHLLPPHLPNTTFTQTIIL